MELQVVGINIEVTQPIREIVDKKVSRLLRYLPNLEEAKVELADEKTKTQAKRFSAQITLKNRGTILRGEEKSNNLNTAIDGAVNTMERQIERFKGRQDDKRIKVDTRPEPGKATTPVKSPGNSVVKVKKFKVRSMTPEHAVEQMELLDHDFFLFASLDSGAINLVYRRKDGNYGLIDTEVG